MKAKPAPMEIIEFQFVLGWAWTSRAIGWFGGGHFSHVDYVWDEDHLIGARYDRIGNIYPGVQFRPANYEPWKERLVLQLEVTREQKTRLNEFYLEQEFKPYDWTAIIGFGVGRDWREDDSWFCSELGAAAVEAAEIMPEIYAPTNRVSPGSFCNCLCAMGARHAEVA